MRIEEVLQIKEQMLGDYSVQAVDGRSLHEALGVKTDFRKWMPRKLIEVSAVEDQDYIKDARTNLTGGGFTVDYLIKLNTAKDISMMSKGESAQMVRDYFKACEKSVQTQVQHQLESPNSTVQKFIADIQYAKLFADVIGADAGKVQKYVIEEGTRVEQETGVKVLVPQLIHDAGLIIDFDAPIGTLAHAAEVGIGTTFTNVTKWAKDMYGKATYSTLINNTLIELGYAIRMNNLKITATNLGSTFANNSPIAKSCHTKLTDTPTVNGWNLEDKRFTDVVFPVIQHKISIGLKK